MLTDIMSVDIQVEIKGPVAEDYSFLKNRYCTKTKTDTIRVIIRELAGIVKEQLLKEGEPNESQEVDSS